LEIPFYDQYFRQREEILAVQLGQELHAADRCIQEALHRCRKANLIYFEPDLLLALVRLEWARVHGQPIPGKIKRLPSLEEPLKEAHDLAQRCGYSLKLADLHLFCGQALLDCRSTGGTGPQPLTLLGRTAPQHLHKAKEYALDVSEFTDLYVSTDPDFYKGIPEYEMLKRGLTKEERIRNGYFPVYQMAETLEAGL
jgi:hypothetical protein